MCGAAGVARETEDIVSCLSESILFTYRKTQKLCFPWRSQAAGDSPFGPCSTLLSASALFRILPFPRLFSESHFWTDLVMQELPVQHRQGYDTAAGSWGALEMHF